MADVNFPSVNDLGTMMNLPFPAYQQAQSQIGLANQFAQQNLQKGQAEQQAMQLANLFAAANNPQKLQQQALQNEGMGFDNRSRGVNARVAEGSEEETLNAKRMKALADASEDQLKIMQSRAIADYQSDDPEKRKSGEQRILLSKKEFDRRQEQKDKLEQIRASGDVKLEGIRTMQDAMSGRNDATIAARLQAQQARDAATAAKANGSPKNAEAAAVRAQMLADEADTPEQRTYYLNQAKGFTAYSMALKNAQAGTKPDMAQFGIQTNDVNTGMGTVNPRPAGMPQQPGMMAPMTNGAGDPPAGSGIVSPADEAHRKAVMQLSPTEQAYLNERDPARKKALEDQIRKERGQTQASGQSAQQTPAAPANVPQGAIQMLRSNPQLAAAFDQKYGAGAAARTLGK